MNKLCLVDYQLALQSFLPMTLNKSYIIIIIYFSRCMQGNPSKEKKGKNCQFS